MTRVAVFIDYQNVYKQARKAFSRTTTPDEGQVYPRRLGLLLTDRGRALDTSRALEAVHVYRGEPTAKHDRKGQAACQRQVRYWASQALVDPWTRPLHYYPTDKKDWQGNQVWEAREKGIDVRLAVDMVLGAKRDEFDVAVLFSCDTDLVPALDGVLAERKRCEVAAWKSPTEWSSRLDADTRKLWCHWLDETDYDRCRDPADYTQELPMPPQANP